MVCRVPTIVRDDGRKIAARFAGQSAADHARHVVAVHLRPRGEVGLLGEHAQKVLELTRGGDARQEQGREKDRAHNSM